MSDRTDSTPATRDQLDHPANRTDHDVVVVGGGAAGLGAAVALARSLRSVIVIDAGEPRNAPAEGVHNLLGREGIAPADLASAGRAEAEGYGAEIRSGEVTTARRTDGGFAVDLADGTTLSTRRLVLATGLVDELPDLPGLRAGWGHSVLHCPYCHGYEVRGQRIGILGTNQNAIHQAMLFRQLSSAVTVFRHQMPDPGEEAWQQLAALDVDVVEDAVREVRTVDGADPVVILADGTEHPLDALVVAPHFRARTDLYAQLGGTATEHPLGEFIESEMMGRTEVEGVWVAGNAGDLAAMVAMSSAAGVAAGAAVNADLVMEDVRSAVAAGQQAVSA